MINEETRRVITEFANNLISQNAIQHAFEINGSQIKVIQLNDSQTSGYWNKESDYFKGRFEFDVEIQKQKLNFSIQLYENTTSSNNRQFRLASFVKSKSQTGMILTINLSKNLNLEKKEISLSTNLTFSQQGYPDSQHPLKTKEEIRKRISELLREINIEIEKSNKIHFGYYDIEKHTLGPQPSVFILNFLKASILKGHFMQNKGFFIPSLLEWKNRL